MECIRDIGREVLRLTVRPHDPLETADADFVLSANSPRCIEGALTSQNHGPTRSHDQRAFRVHQHRRLGVEIALRTDTDSVDEDVNHSMLDDYTVLMEAKTPLLDAYRILNLDEERWEAEKGESDTLGGFMIEQSERLLRVGEAIEFDGVKLIVDAGDSRKIHRIKVLLPRGDEEESDTP